MITKKDVSKTYERLFVQSSIFLGNHIGIYERPYITLSAYKDAISEWYGPYEIYMHVCGYDNFGYAYVYRMQNEEEFFNILHEDGFTIAGIAIDINPITEDKTGLLAEYLESVEQYLKEKAQERKLEKPSVREKIKQAKQISQDRKTGGVLKSRKMLKDSMRII